MFAVAVAVAVAVVVVDRRPGLAGPAAVSGRPSKCWPPGLVVAAVAVADTGTPAGSSAGPDRPGRTGPWPG